MATRLSPDWLDRVAQKWRRLAERRRAHLVELYHSGRWKHYFTEEQFLACLRAAIKASERWAELAPSPPRETVAEPQTSAEARERPAA